MHHTCVHAGAATGATGLSDSKAVARPRQHVVGERRKSNTSHERNVEAHEKLLWYQLTKIFPALQKEKPGKPLQEVGPSELLSRPVRSATPKGEHPTGPHMGNC